MATNNQNADPPSCSSMPVGRLFDALLRACTNRSDSACIDFASGTMAKKRSASDMSSESSASAALFATEAAASTSGNTSDGIGVGLATTESCKLAILSDFEKFGGGQGGVRDSLRLRNPIPVFDDSVRFDESPDPVTGVRRHDYYVRDTFGWRKYKGSCTGTIKKFFPGFDGDAVYDGMEAAGRIANPADQYYGMSKEAVLEQWARIGEDASNNGREMHHMIELHLNNAADLNDPRWTSDELKERMGYYLDWWEAEFRGKWVLLRTELPLVDEAYEFAGCSDCIAQRVEWLADPEKANWVAIIDWKGTKKTFDERVYGVGWGPCAGIPNAKKEHHGLQASLYATCLMRRTKYIVKELWLGIFHEVHKRYRWIPLEPRFDAADRIIVTVRQERINAYLASLLKNSGAFLGVHGEAEPVFADARALSGLLREAVEFGATTEAILGINKRRRHELKN